jgi:hypothetical protein
VCENNKELFVEEQSTLHKMAEREREGERGAHLDAGEVKGRSSGSPEET